MNLRRFVAVNAFLLLGISSTALAGDLDYPPPQHMGDYNFRYDHSDNYDHEVRHRYGRSRSRGCRRGWHDKGPSRCPYATYDEAWQACIYSNGQVIKAYRNGRFVGYICTDEGVTGG